MNQKALQLDLLHRASLLLKPVLDVIGQPEMFSATERARIRAQFGPNCDILHNQLLSLCRSEPGADYATEFHDIQEPLAHIRNLVTSSLVNAPADMGDIELLRRKLQAAIMAVPISAESSIYETGTPFTTYLRIRELCASARQTLVFIDRYLDHTIFHRFLEDLQPQVHVTLLTWPRNAPRNSAARYDAFIDVSRLYAAQHAADYRLLVNLAIHDRYLWMDGNLFSLGGSVKDAGGSTPYTLTNLKLPADEMKPIQDQIDNATELYGPNQPARP